MSPSTFGNFNQHWTIGTGARTMPDAAGAARRGSRGIKQQNGDQVMSATALPSHETLSPWWPRTVAIVMVIGFAVLIMMSIRAYQNAPPIPEQVKAPEGDVVFTAADVAAGQEVFLKYGLMDNGTIWGHGAY